MVQIQLVGRRLFGRTELRVCRIARQTLLEAFLGYVREQSLIEVCRIQYTRKGIVDVNVNCG